MLKVTCACVLSLFLLTYGKLSGQVVNTATMDTLETTMLGHVGFGAYVDTYYAYNFLKPAENQTPYLVSSARHNEVSINLAYIDVRYRSQRVRARFVPGFGTYVNANYVQEPGSLKNIIEGYVGVKIFPKKDIWLDMGVLGSPYTNESAVSKDHLMYSRSFAPEYVPYYLSGLKVSIPLGQQLNVFLYLLNGWQVIEDNNNAKALGTQLEYRPSKKLLINWNTYTGSERSLLNPTFKTRYFSDLFFIYQVHPHFLMTACIYGGIQEKDNNTSSTWWQGNINGRYQLSDKVSISGRAEYFDDADNVVIGNDFLLPFSAGSAGLCLNIKIGDNALFRLEQRSFFSKEFLFENNEQDFFKSYNLIISSLTAWF